MIFAPNVTLKIAVAKSPTLGVQPLLPPHPVISIVYSPARTLPTKKLPVGAPLPALILQAPSKIIVADVELEIVHDVSVGRKPTPFAST